MAAWKTLGNLYRLLCIITVKFSTNGNSERDCPKEATLERAINCCEKKGGNYYLPTIQTQEDKLSIGRDIGEGETWVNLKLDVNIEWKITGKRTIANYNTKPGWKYKDGQCGIMKKSMSRIGLESCSQFGLGAICEYEDCESCMSLGRHANNCFNLERRCYVVFCGFGNWYDARVKCKRQSADLAPPDENILHTFTRKRLPSIPGWCQTTWIGLYRDDWVQIKSLANGYVNIPLWAPGQPDSTGSCAILRWLENGYYLITVDCDETHKYICQDYPEAKGDKRKTTMNTDVFTLDSTTTFPPSLPESPPSPGTMPWVMLTIISIAFILIQAILIYAYTRWRRRKFERYRPWAESKKKDDHYGEVARTPLNDGKSWSSADKN